jgi:hypothetical protein
MHVTYNIKIIWFAYHRTSSSVFTKLCAAESFFILWASQNWQIPSLLWKTNVHNFPPGEQAYIVTQLNPVKFLSRTKFQSRGVALLYRIQKSWIQHSVQRTAVVEAFPAFLRSSRPELFFPHILSKLLFINNPITLRQIIWATKSAVKQSRQYNRRGRDQTMQTYGASYTHSPSHP